MTMIINNNISAINSQRTLKFKNWDLGKDMRELSSGLRINRAGDDASGLAVSEKMRTQIRGLKTEFLLFKLPKVIFKKVKIFFKE